MPAKGAYAMKTTWLYDENAEVNPESDITEGSSKDENDIKITEGEEVFTFDAATGTITAYTGRSTQVEVPAFIKNIPVKKIGERAFDGTSKDIKRKIRKKILPLHPKHLLHQLQEQLQLRHRTITTVLQ